MRVPPLELDGGGAAPTWRRHPLVLADSGAYARHLLSEAKKIYWDSGQARCRSLATSGQGPCAAESAVTKNTHTRMQVHTHTHTHTHNHTHAHTNPNRAEPRRTETHQLHTNAPKQTDATRNKPKRTETHRNAPKRTESARNKFKRTTSNNNKAKRIEMYKDKLKRPEMTHNKRKRTEKLKNTQNIFELGTNRN